MKPSRHRTRALQILNDLHYAHMVKLRAIADTYTDGTYDAHELVEEANRRAFADLPQHLTADEWASFRDWHMRNSRRIVTSIANADRSAGPDGVTPRTAPMPRVTSNRSRRRRAEAEERIRSGLPITAHVTRHGSEWVASIPGLFPAWPRPTRAEAEAELLSTVRRFLDIDPRPDLFEFREITRDRPNSRL
jgi:hypothetical protein